jgi:mannobiose 2-epimerase
MLTDNRIKERLQLYQKELNAELQNILAYWIDHTPDYENDGFYGKLDHQNKVDCNAPKGSVLNARLLWAFSASYNFNGIISHLQFATRAFEYIKKCFIDKTNGGIYWTVTYNGEPLETKKQVYANAFMIYALSEYHKASGVDEAKRLAISLYELLVEKSFDKKNGGYFEAFTHNWQPISDLRLSAKDANEKKSMNTHLHVLEAYSNLYTIWPDAKLKQQIEMLLHNFIDHIIDLKTGHLVLFFDEEWNRKSDTISYGHDIEAAWLLLEAAEVINSEHLITQLKLIAVKLAEATIEGLDGDFGLWYEYETCHRRFIFEKHWWVQSEAMVGFFNAFEITGEERYADLSISNWNFVKDHILDKEHGEWIWGIDAKGRPMPGQDKVGVWKCPYHNSRACMEIIKRIDRKSLEDVNS